MVSNSYVLCLPTRRYSVLCHARDAYESNGYVTIKQFLNNDQVALVIAELETFKKHCMKTKKLNAPPFRALGDAGVLQDLRNSCFGVEIFGTPGNVDTIGHGLHYLADSLCAEFAVRSPAVKELLETLTGMADPVVVQTKAVMKPAKTGTRVPTHTDEQYIFTEPRSGLALWIALDSASKSNGCVEVVPGSHKQFHPGQLFAADERGTITWQPLPLNDAPTTLKPFPYSKAENDALDWVSIETQPGDCLVMHHALLHASSANTSGEQRRALTVHLVDGGCEWDSRNWIVPHPERDFVHI